MKTKIDARNLVVTWNDPTGNAITICRDCEAKLRERGEWPRNHTGQEYCQVRMGEHRGLCELLSHGRIKVDSRGFMSY